MNTTHYIGLDVHKKSVSDCTKLADGTIVAEGKVAARREDLRKWAKQLPQPWKGQWRRPCSAVGFTTR